MLGRGIDFEQKFKTSRWAEDLLLDGLNEIDNLIAVRFGISEAKQTGKLIYDKIGPKDPDILVLKRNTLSDNELRILNQNDLSKIPRTQFSPSADFGFVIKKSIVGVEVEFSPYKASKMKGRNWLPKTKEQWAKRTLKNANPPTAPNIWIKAEDILRLQTWENHSKIKIIVAHVFDEEAFCVSLAKVCEIKNLMEKHPNSAVKIQNTSGIFHKIQTYDRTDAQGAKEKKPVFIITPAAAIKIGDIKGVCVTCQLGVSASQKYVTHPIFSGGKIVFAKDFYSFLTGFASV